MLHYSIYLIETGGGKVLTVSAGIVFLAGSLFATRKILEGLEVFGGEALLSWKANINKRIP